MRQVEAHLENTPPAEATPGDQQRFCRISPGHFVLQTAGVKGGAGGGGGVPQPSPTTSAAGSRQPEMTATPLSQQGSRVSSALVDSLNLALRALGEPQALRGRREATPAREHL